MSITCRFQVDLCQYITVSAAAKHVQLNWHQVRQIDKAELKKRHAHLKTQGLEIMSIDEISIKKHPQTSLKKPFLWAVTTPRT